VNLCPENLIIGYNNKERADLMIVRSSNKCYYCDKEIKWFVTIKGGEIEEIGFKMNEERGIHTFTGKQKIDIDVICPSCKNVNRFKKSLKEKN
jgi:hypothetical protein